MDRITYDELVSRFGKNTALDLLRCIENLAQIRNDIIEMDSDKRFQRALDALNETNCADAIVDTQAQPITIA